MTSTEAIDRMVAILEKAESAADNALVHKAELYVKIADQWHDVAWQLAEAEKPDTPAA